MGIQQYNPSSSIDPRARITSAQLSQNQMATGVQSAQSTVIDRAHRLELASGTLVSRLGSLLEALQSGPTSGALASMAQPPQPPRGLNDLLQAAIESIEVAHNQISAISQHIGLEV